LQKNLSEEEITEVFKRVATGPTKPSPKAEGRINQVA